MNNNRDIIIKIDNIVYGGYGLGRINGKVIFVESAIPGDIVKITIKEDHKDYSTAIIENIIEPSPERIKPDCPVSHLCGGCSYLHVNYATELEYKRRIIKDQLKRVARMDEDLPEIETISEKRYGYRSHTRFNSDNNIKGFFKKGSNQIVEFPSKGCLLLSDEISGKIKDYKTKSVKTEVKAASDYNGVIHFCENNSSAEIIEYEQGIYFHRDINGFFQANRYLRDKMIQAVINLPSIETKNTFLDICSGCGFFTLPLALRTDRGYGFDIDSGSISYAKKNAEINSIKNVSFYKLSESEIKPHLYKPDFIIIDPPRSGLSKKGRWTVNTINTGEIIYISCNPSTFARDLKDFLKNGYKLERLIFIDMFPCTYHIEIISHLIKS